MELGSTGAAGKEKLNHESWQAVRYAHRTLRMMLALERLADGLKSNECRTIGAYEDTYTRRSRECRNSSRRYHHKRKMKKVKMEHRALQKIRTISSSSSPLFPLLLVPVPQSSQNYTSHSTIRIILIIHGIRGYRPRGFLSTRVSRSSSSGLRRRT